MNRNEVMEYVDKNKDEILDFVLSNNIYRAQKYFGLKSPDPIFTILIKTGRKDMVPPSALLKRGITTDRVVGSRKLHSKPVVTRSSKIDMTPLENVEGMISGIITVYEFAKKAEAYEEENNKLRNIVESQKQAIIQLQKKIDDRNSLQLRAEAVAHHAVVIHGD